MNRWIFSAHLLSVLLCLWIFSYALIPVFLLLFVSIADFLDLKLSAEVMDVFDFAEKSLPCFPLAVASLSPPSSLLVVSS
uniref:Uncharacterized protein n=1 Tax=Panstrongylus lignarius TaxID=156445 RepID=A0A224Y3F4_9HEMI